MNKNIKFRKLNSGDRIGIGNSSVDENYVMEFLDEYFEELEMDNLKNKGEVHSELVMNIIKQFKRIFKLWDENRIFAIAINENTFKNIFNSMRCTFADDDDHRGKLVADELLFNLQCKQCGQEFPLRNKDCVYSFKYHTITSATHKDFLNNLNTIDYDTIEELVGDTTVDPEIVISKNSIHTRCYLCSEHIMSNDCSEFENFEDLTDRVRVHCQSITHRNNCRLFRENGQYIEDVCRNKNVFRCKVCLENLFIDEVVQHFNSEQHKNKVAAVEAGGINSILDKMCI